MSKRVKEVRDTSSDDESSYRSGTDDSDSSDDTRNNNKHVTKKKRFSKRGGKERSRSLKNLGEQMRHFFERWFTRKFKNFVPKNSV